MAESQPPVLQQARQSTAPPAPKLRDSCHNCAASKLRCSKDKPTCARCAKRGKVCEYFATRRPGRKHGNRPHNLSLPNVGQSSSTSLPTPSNSGTNVTAPLDNIQDFLHRYASSYAVSLASPAFSVEPHAFPEPLSPADLNVQFNDYFASPVSFSLPEVPDGANGADFTINTQDIDSLLDSGSTTPHPESTFSVLNDVGTQLTTPSEPQNPLTSQPSSTCLLSALQGTLSDVSCSCLIRALGLMRRLCPSASMRCTTQASQEIENGGAQQRPINSVMADNEHTIDAISSMLSCPCSQDSYLLTIVSLIVFKVLAWYAAAARETPVLDEGPNSNRSQAERGSHYPEQVSKSLANMDSCYDNGENEGRMAAQLVLGKLHRVQRLVNVLSGRLKGEEMYSRGKGTSSTGPADGQPVVGRGDIAFPFSDTLLAQIEVDLRKRLRALSAEVVNTLRRA